jgi:hypothetical protein
LKIYVSKNILMLQSFSGICQKALPRYCYRYNAFAKLPTFSKYVVNPIGTKINRYWVPISVLPKQTIKSVHFCKIHGKRQINRPGSLLRQTSCKRKNFNLYIYRKVIKNERKPIDRHSLSLF